MSEEIVEPTIDLGEYQFGFHDDVEPFSAVRGSVKKLFVSCRLPKGSPNGCWISAPEILRRLQKMPMQTWRADLSQLILMTSFTTKRPLKNLPEAGMMYQTKSRAFERIGIPEAERAYLAGAAAQCESKWCTTI